MSPTISNISIDFVRLLLGTLNDDDNIYQQPDSGSQELEIVNDQKFLSRIAQSKVLAGRAIKCLNLAHERL